MSKKNRWNQGNPCGSHGSHGDLPSADGNLAGICQVQQSSTGKEQALREQNEEICESVRNAKQENNGAQTTMTFQAVSADGEVTGNQVFSVPVIPGKNRQNIRIKGMKPGQWFYVYGAVAKSKEDPLLSDTKEDTGGGEGS